MSSGAADLRGRATVDVLPRAPPIPHEASVPAGVRRWLWGGGPTEFLRVESLRRLEVRDG